MGSLAYLVCVKCEWDVRGFYPPIEYLPNCPRCDGFMEGFRVI